MFYWDSVITTVIISNTIVVVFEIFIIISKCIKRSTVFPFWYFLTSGALLKIKRDSACISLKGQNESKLWPLSGSLQNRRYFQHKVRTQLSFLDPKSLKGVLCFAQFGFKCTLQDKLDPLLVPRRTKKFSSWISLSRQTDFPTKTSWYRWGQYF